MPQDYQTNDISQSSEDYNISLLSENETIWETIEGKKYVHLLQVFFYDPNNKHPENEKQNIKYKHLNLPPGLIVEPDRSSWSKYFKKNLPKKYKILHYELKNFKKDQLMVEAELKNTIFSKCSKEISKVDSYACNNPRSKKELNYYKTDKIELELRIKENLLIHYPNTCIAIFGEESTLKEIKLKNVKKV